MPRRGFPATIFVASGLLGREGSWWDRLADGRGCLDPALLRRLAFERAEGQQDEILEAWVEKAGGPLPASYRPATEEQLRETVARHPGSPSRSPWRHRCLPSCREAPLPLSPGSRTDGSATAPTTLTFGVSRTPWRRNDGIVRAVAGTYRWAMRVDAGRLSRGWDTDPHRMPRINVSRGGTSKDLLLRLSGLV